MMISSCQKPALKVRNFRGRSPGTQTAETPTCSSQLREMVTLTHGLL